MTDTLASGRTGSIDGISRRQFIAATPMGAGLLGARLEGAPGKPADDASESPPSVQRLDLAPARWIWYPSERTLPNTFVLFRRVIDLPDKPRSAKGWILADSRYLLSLNGGRIQWGPAPADPRWPEADPVDLTDRLRPGRNVLGATVLHYGLGEGTWPIGKPGFILRLEIEKQNGERELIFTDVGWRARLARSWPPGRCKRWYLRALQEVFDARLYPYGWDSEDFEPGDDWLPALVLDCPSDKPSICSTYPDYALDSQGEPAACDLRGRSIPPLKEPAVAAAGLADSFRVRWMRPPEEYFDFRTPGAFVVEREPCVDRAGPGSWSVPPSHDRAVALTFEFEEQVVGWPYFTVEAPAGTVVELMTQEAHDKETTPWLDTQFYSWSRFTCREGTNRFETFDFESLRWLQLHIRGAERPVTVRDVGVRRRIYPWPHRPEISVSDPALDRLVRASINTLNNSAQETIVDGMARERQQYSGDCGHQVHALYMAFGETLLPARYLRTYSDGMTLDGYFLDSWPAYDRLARLMERQVNMTSWGPILDHGVGFNFDCWHHYLYTSDLESLREPYPRLVRFFEYLGGLRREDGLLPVENIGVPTVWIDHQAYERQRHKQCAFNLYAAAMLRHAFAPLAREMGDSGQARQAESLSADLLAAVQARFWDRQRLVYVNNLPWLREEGKARMCDRSLATAILFGQCPGGRTESSMRALADCPPDMGFSYPANAGWRLWALARGGRGDLVVRDLRTRWSGLPSVLRNNTLQEDWNVQPDSTKQWSHCPVVPLYVLYMDIAGIRPVEPGFRLFEVRPQLGDLNQLSLVARTVRGPIAFSSSGDSTRRRVRISVPEACTGLLLHPPSDRLSLAPLAERRQSGLVQYSLPAGKTTEYEVVHGA
jgi:alpha-L-rhamnosidase